MVTKQSTTRNVLQQQEIEAHQLLTQSLNVLSDRIQKTESDFVGHLKKVEDRLDQIVDLTKTVAVLQTQTTSQNELIAEVRTSQRDYAAKNDQSISRIHTRIEEVQNHNRDKLELVVKEQELDIKDIRTKTDGTEKELKQWLNRGIGAWLVFGLLLGGFNTMLWRWVDSIDKERQIIATTIDVNKKEHLMYENRLASIEALSKENTENIKRLLQITSDTDRQVDFLRNQKK